MEIGVRRCFQALAVTTFLALPGCIQEFKDVNAFAARSENSTTAWPMPHMSIRQAQAMQNQLQVKLSDSMVLQAREEARGTIEKVLTISGCYPSWDIRRYLTAYSTSDSRAVEPPMLKMKYHPRSRCLTVTRLDSWSIPSEGTLAFRAVFLSDVSLETSLMRYEMVKQPDGAWLLH